MQDIITIISTHTSSWEIEAVIKILISALFSTSIGWERSKKEKPVGTRTCVIVSVTATLFTVISMYGFRQATGVDSDPARLAAQILTGIGFIGAGAILRDHSEHIIRGITTASTIWALTAIGMAVGVGSYLLAAVVSFIVLLTLNAPKRRYHRDTEVNGKYPQKNIDGNGKYK